MSACCCSLDPAQGRHISVVELRLQHAGHGTKLTGLPMTAWDTQKAWTFEKLKSLFLSRWNMCSALPLIVPPLKWLLR